MKHQASAQKKQKIEEKKSDLPELQDLMEDSFISMAKLSQIETPRRVDDQAKVTEISQTLLEIEKLYQEKISKRAAHYESTAAQENAKLTKTQISQLKNLSKDQKSKAQEDQMISRRKSSQLSTKMTTQPRQSLAQQSATVVVDTLSSLEEQMFANEINKVKNPLFRFHKRPEVLDVMYADCLSSF